MALSVGGWLLSAKYDTRAVRRSGLAPSYPPGRSSSINQLGEATHLMKTLRGFPNRLLFAPDRRRENEADSTVYRGLKLGHSVRMYFLGSVEVEFVGLEPDV